MRAYAFVAAVAMAFLVLPIPVKAAEDCEELNLETAVESEHIDIIDVSVIAPQLGERHNSINIST